MQLDHQDRNTILAALRYYQREGMGEPENRDDEIHDIATDGGRDISMDADGIDDLCERFNLAGDDVTGELADFMAELFACYSADGEFNTITAPLGTIEIRDKARELGRKLGVTFDNDEGE